MAREASAEDSMVAVFVAAVAAGLVATQVFGLFEWREYERDAPRPRRWVLR